MSFLRRLKERRVKASQNVTPSPALPESEPAWADEGRKGPLADFVAQSQNERTEGSVDLGQANGSWSQGKQRSRLSKTIRVRKTWAKEGIIVNSSFAGGAS